jgi:branched-chain amino acid transport system substrate-binding protein
MRVRAVVALALALALVASACGGSGKRPFRIGILSDCFGPFGGAHELNLADAELPLIGRGARPNGRKPSAGITPVEIAGRRVELLVGCVSGSEDVIPEARRLVEEEGARALVGPITPEQGMALRQYARRQPNVAFLTQPTAAPELTLDAPARNVFRFAPDAAQTSAGLGSYAFRQLGWRRAAIVAEDAPFAWEESAGFIAEFCALGGRIVARDRITVGTDPGAAAGRVPASVDGVYLGVAVSPMKRFLDRFGAARDGISGKVVSNNTLFNDPALIPAARGVVVGGPLAFDPIPAQRAFASALRTAFPGIPAASAINSASIPFANGVQAAIAGLERARGADGQPFLSALARVRIDSPMGPIRLDGNRQAIEPNYLSRVVPAGRDVAPRPLRVVPDVEQTFGGYFAAGGPPASDASPRCAPRAPPPWAR